MPIPAGFIFPHPPLILPEVGKGREEDVASTSRAMTECAAQIARIKPDTIVLFSPHAACYADYLHISPGSAASGDMSRFGAPKTRVAAEYDAELVSALCREAESAGIPAGTRGERERGLDHGALVPLWFVNNAYSGFRLVRIGLSGLSPLVHYRFGMCVKRAVEALGRRAVALASGDLSHKLTPDGPYGFSPSGPEFDRRVTGAMAEGDFLSFLTMPPQLCEGAAECGLRAFQMLAGAFDGEKVEPRLLSYEGPFGVGYAVASFISRGEDADRRFEKAYQDIEAEGARRARQAESPLVRLARACVESFTRTGKPLALSDFKSEIPDEFLSGKAGVFVSLKIRGELRGCIGTIKPVTGCVAEEVLRNAVSACSEDPRFPPVERGELNALTYSVDVLGQAEDIDGPEALDPSRYGVIVSSGFRRGLLLPMLEGIDTAEEQVDIARRKAGIPNGASVKLQRFEVVRYK